MPEALETVPTLDLPARLELPIFDYGLLKPDQLAYDRLLSPCASATEPATLPTGGLRYRDGLPLLDPDGEGGVDGVLVDLAGGQELPAYQAVSSFAPRQHYRWVTTKVRAGEREITANALLGRHPDRGSADEWFRSWSASTEPLFGHGVHAVRASAMQHAVAPFPAVGGESPELWQRFFALQAAYLLLWAAVERFSALAFGPSEAVLARLYRLGDDLRFRECVVAAGVVPSPKTADRRDPQRWRRVRGDGAGAMYSWESVRSSPGHPGTTAYQDGVTVRRALVELHDTFRLHLLTRLPDVASTWSELDPAGSEHRWLLRPVVASDGLG
ncbi:MAG: hypothetical protein ACRD1K_07510 [Acidimicrobiales bacterium]